MKEPRIPIFRVGIHRALQFLYGVWLTPLAEVSITDKSAESRNKISLALKEGYSRAIPLRFLPTFPEKAVRSLATPSREWWQAGLQFVAWVRQQLDQCERAHREILLVADGSYDVLDFWRGIPEQVMARHPLRQKSGPL